MAKVLSDAFSWHAQFSRMEHLTCTNRIRMPRQITCFDLWTENLYTNPLSLLPTWLLQESRGIVFGVAA